MKKSADSNFLCRNLSPVGLGGFKVASQPEAKAVFRAMILAELRAGRLTRSGRARIVRYSSRIGLSAVDAGKLIAECAEEALKDADPKVQQIALRLAAPPPARVFWLTSLITIGSGVGFIAIWAMLKGYL